MIEGILWDRIGDRGPVFEVCEVRGETASRFRLQAGRKGKERLGDETIAGGILADEPDFSVKSVVLDHGVPVLAYSFEERKALHVRPEAVLSLGIPPGPWLSELKRLVLADRDDEVIELPDGSRRNAIDLGGEILHTRPGEKIVYATDFDDTAENRAGLLELARGARVFFCEASFVDADRHLARATQHLTARACGEIAREAQVSKLVPFHFSKRYENAAHRVYREVRDAFSGTIVVAT
jgi:ribonuclease BN (tRNA processing enzyme)